MCIRSSDTLNQIANFYDNQIVFYKQIVFNPDCTFSGANAPYTITQIDSMLSTNFFTKTDINNMFINYYNKSAIDANFLNYNTKTEITGLLALKQNNISSGISTYVSSNFSGTKVVIAGADGKMTLSSCESSKLLHLANVTSDIQNQFTGKQATIIGGATSITQSDLTVGRALISDSFGKVAVSNVSDVQLGYLSDVTDNIQAQLNNTSNIVKFVSGTGNVFYTPTTGSNLPSIIMTPEGGTVATFKHDFNIL